MIKTDEANDVTARNPSEFLFILPPRVEGAGMKADVKLEDELAR